MSAEDRQTAIRRLCQLQALVAAATDDYRHAADCFCGESGFHPLGDPDDYRNDFKAIEFIERAVRLAVGVGTEKPATGDEYCSDCLEATEVAGCKDICEYHAAEPAA